MYRHAAIASRPLFRAVNESDTLGDNALREMRKLDLGSWAPTTSAAPAHGCAGPTAAQSSDPDATWTIRLSVFGTTSAALRIF